MTTVTLSECNESFTPDHSMEGAVGPESTTRSAPGTQFKGSFTITAQTVIPTIRNWIRLQADLSDIQLNVSGFSTQFPDHAFRAPYTRSCLVLHQRGMVEASGGSVGSGGNMRVWFWLLAKRRIGRSTVRQ
uniref:Uncharacterized protein n=1 Tax=Mesocestoides corti TaxID=53468 RepID=A0A5K3F9S1_MESCO